MCLVISLPIVGQVTPLAGSLDNLTLLLIDASSFGLASISRRCAG
jgi:hypothetical protein